MGTLRKSKGFKLVHLNVRSIPKKIDQLRILLDNAKLDVLTISVTWLNKSINSQSVQIKGFVAFRQDRVPGTGIKKRGGGLLTLINEKYATECEELLDLNKASSDIEAHWSIIYRPHCKNVVVGNIYRPPSGNLDKAVKYIDDCVREFDLNKLEIFIMGDSNMNYKNKTLKEYKKVNFLTQSNGLSQVINNTTRNTDKTKSLLDLIITNSKYIKVAGTLNHYISDHQPVFAIKKKVVVKEMFRALLPQVTFMMNLSLDMSIFPMAWKEALVVPTPKGGNLMLVQNYRPISLLPLPGKVLEKLMHKQITNYLEKESLLTDNQHGFRSRHSTVHSIAQLTLYINKKAADGLPTLATFVDFRKAFDCVQQYFLKS